MAPGSGPEPGEEQDKLTSPRAGWVRLDGVGDPANIFLVDRNRPDYPEKWRSREEAGERRLLAKDTATRAVIDRLRTKWDPLDFAQIVEAQVRGAEIREHIGNDEINRLAGMLRDGFYSKIRLAAEEVAPGAGVSHVTAIHYIAEQTLPPELVLYVVDEAAEPVKIIVNADPRRKLVLSLSPGEVMLRFQGIARRDINKIGRFITEALEIADPKQRRNRPGRPAITDEEGPETTHEMVARLHHWEGWSHRRIAAFLGWLGPNDDWADPKVRTRTEQRVRRRIRLGEGALQMGLPSDDANDESWRRRPPALTAAVGAEDGRKERGR